MLLTGQIEHLMLTADHMHFWQYQNAHNGIHVMHKIKQNMSARLL